MHKKRRSIVLAVIFAVCSLVIIGVGYHYIADSFVNQIDAAIGVEKIQIKNLNVDKTYMIRNGVNVPAVRLSYNTTTDSTSYLIVEGISTNSKRGRGFNENVVFDESSYGKDIRNGVIKKIEFLFRKGG